MQEPKGADLLSARGVAELLGVNPSTVQKWRAGRQELPFMKIGGQFYYQRTDVLAYLERSHIEVER
jgi:excisionase family DNA binding protein